MPAKLELPLFILSDNPVALKIIFTTFKKTKMLETAIINFDNLSAFSNNNTEFNKKLLLAFIEGLEKLQSVLKEFPTEEEVITSRKIIHTIYPSLKMLQTTDLTEKIEKYSLFLKGQNSISPEELAEISELINTIELRVKEKLAAAE